VLVLNKRGKPRWLSGTIARQKSPVTNLVKVGHRMRFCHADHLLHSTVTNIGSEPDINDVPKITPASTEPEATDSVLETEPEGVSVPVSV